MPHILVLILIVGISALMNAGFGQDPDQGPPPSPKSPVVKKAEADYQEALSIAEKEYLQKVRQASTKLTKDLERAKDLATKNRDLDETVAIRDRIAEVAAATPAVPRVGPTLIRDKLGRELAETVWIGHQNWWRFVLKPDSTVQFVDRPDKTARWGPISDDLICIVHGDFTMDVLVFDADRRSVKGYYRGKTGISWEAQREMVNK